MQTVGFISDFQIPYFTCWNMLAVVCDACNNFFARMLIFSDFDLNCYYQIRSFFWSVISRIGKIRTRKISVFGNFLRSVLLSRNLMWDGKFHYVFFTNTNTKFGSKFTLYYRDNTLATIKSMISLKGTYLGLIQKIRHEIFVRHKI